MYDGEIQLTCPYCLHKHFILPQPLLTQRERPCLECERAFVYVTFYPLYSWFPQAIALDAEVHKAFKEGD